MKLNTDNSVLDNSGKSSRWINKIIRPELSTVLLLVITIWLSTRLSPYFADVSYIFDSTSLYIEYGIIALSMTFIIISGEIDLSVASNIALTGCITASFYHIGLSMATAILIGLFFGAIFGLFNGLVVTKLKLPSIIVTIGTMTLYRGIAQILLGDHSLGHFPDWFFGIDMKYLGIVPYPLAIFAFLAIILGLILNFTVFGRYVYAVGTNDTAARYSGLKVDHIKLILFTLSGLFAAIGGIIMISRLGVARYDMATGGELDIVLIVLLGGTDIFGGKGNIWGTVLAMFLVIILRTGMLVANIKIESQLAVLGSLLILSIIVSNYIYRRG